MLLQTHIALGARNTLAVNATAEYFCEATDVASLAAALTWAQDNRAPVWVLGGGSNVLCADLIEGLVVCPKLLGKYIVEDNGNFAVVELAAGENWHEAVVWAMQQGLYGLENLALIPGTAGAAPIQNIGAYGVELAACLVAVKAFNRVTEKEELLSAEACELGYRDSIFKHRMRHSHVITAVQLRLSRCVLGNASYPALAAALGTLPPTPNNIFASVCSIRRSKLPDPAELPNCGSFFKNPIVNTHTLARLLERYPHLPHYPAGADNVKIAAAWLIEQAGWRGRDYQGVVVHAKQALVLTNPRRQSSGTILAAAAAITRDVAEQFQLALEIEPQILGKIPALLAP